MISFSVLWLIIALIGQFIQCSSSTYARINNILIGIPAGNNGKNELFPVSSIEVKDELDNTIPIIQSHPGDTEGSISNEEDGVGDNVVEKKKLVADDGDDDDDDDLSSQSYNKLNTRPNSNDDDADDDDDDSDDNTHDEDEKGGDVDSMDTFAEEDDIDLDIVDSSPVAIDNEMGENITQQSLSFIKSAWKDMLNESASEVAPELGPKAALYTAIFSQFNDPLGVEVSGRRSKWLDQEFVLTLKGLGVLANNPLMINARSKHAFPHISRAVKIATSKATQSIQLTISKALAASIKARVLVLNKKTIDLLRDRVVAAAETEGLDIPKPLLIRANLLNTLFHMASYEDIPLVVVFSGDVSWITDSISVCDVLIQEIKNSFSTVFFMMLSSQGSTMGNTQAQISSSSSTSQQQQQGEGGQPGMEQMMQQLSDMGINLPPGGLFGTLPPGALPPGFTMGPNGMQPPPGTAFQMALKNGSMVLTAMTQGQPPSHLPPGTPPTNDMMRRIMQDQQRRLGGSDVGSGPSGSSDMQPGTPESFREAMQDPEVQALLRDLVGRIMSKSGGFSNDPANPTPVGVEIKVMVGGPPPPFGVPPNVPPSPSNSPGGNNKGLGGFFRGLKPRGTPDPNSASQQQQAPQRQASPYERTGSGESSRGKDQVLLSLFEQIYLQPPTYHVLRSQWDQMIDDQIRQRIFKSNVKLLKEELEVSELPTQVHSNMQVLETTLGSKLMTKAEVKRAIEVALTLQAAKQMPRSDAPTTTGTFEVGGPVTLSLWALETGLAAVIPSLIPRLGKPVARSKDDVNALAVDKHEKALVANVIAPQDIGVTYDMIGGLSVVKETLRQCITYPLKYPRLYQEGIAAEAVKGVLLFGPPGTGKTMLAKAVATEGGATFLSIDTSSIENKWLGESEKNARAVFTLARRLAPCVIYLDEVDSILSSREHGDESSHGTLTSVKTTLMQEWDGLRTTKDRVVVIASTNRPFDLDEAVLRRLPRRIMVDLPDLETRIDILNVTLSGNRITNDVNITLIAEDLEGYSGSDIKEVCREAVVRVAHEKASMMETEGGNLANLNDIFITRAVNSTDFKEAMKKLKASVDENSRELQKVMEWNEKYGEVKHKKQSSKRSSQHLSMYI